MQTDDRPPQRDLWSKHAWKTVREAMRSNPATFRLVFIICAICSVPTVALALSVLVLRAALF